MNNLIRSALLAVSFGTSYHETRDITIGAIESTLATAFPDFRLKRAFTSQVIIDLLAKRDQLYIDNVPTAIQKLLHEGVTHLVVQPTHVISGYEYDDMVREVIAFRDQFTYLAIGTPLLTEDEDYTKVATAIIQATKEVHQQDTAILLMGHGTEHPANSVYTTLQQRFNQMGYPHYMVGTVEGKPTLEDILPTLKERQVKKIVLLPLMVVAGDHAINDMAGDEEDSWKNQLIQQGYEVSVLLQGLGELHDIRQIYLEHLKKAIRSPQPSSPFSKNPEKMSQILSPPIYPQDVPTGSYAIQVHSDSSMFQIAKCELIAKDNKLTAILTIAGQSYGKLFIGTEEEAYSALPKQHILPLQVKNNTVSFALPITALNQEIQLSAWSIRKESWYNRKLIFPFHSI